MKKLLYTILSLTFLLAIAFTFYKCSSKKAMTQAQKENVGNAAAYYEEYCASCHGKNAKKFVERKQWVYGETRNDIFAVIKNGADADGMPAYGKVLSDAQIYDMTDYILATIEDKKAAEFAAGENDDIVFVSEGMKLKLELVADNIDSPWSITQSNDGTLFYTDKSGKLFSKNKSGEIAEIKGLPKVSYKSQGGLMDIILHPNFDENKKVYLTYSKPKPDDADWSTTAVFCGVLENNELKNGKDIFVAEPYENTFRHYGSRMIFDKDGYLFVTVGERGRRDEYPQKLDNHLGKVLRLNDDGSAPKDNPFFDTPNAKKEIYSYGHRNPQGLCYDAENDIIYDNEHGPKGGDEINLIKKGANYGWPVITYGINYVGTKITDLTEKEGMEQPQRYWVPSIATCGMAFVSSDKYPKWKGNILSGALKFDYLHRDVFDENGKFIKEEKLFPNIGRMRSIVQCADGYLYFGVENPGKIYKIVPVN